MGLISDMTRFKPFIIIIIVNVAIKGGSFIFATIKPFITPHITPVIIPKMMHSQMGHPQIVSAVPLMMAVKVMIGPTDKSIPAVMMTNVTPMARQPFTHVDKMMVMILE